MPAPYQYQNSSGPDFGYRPVDMSGFQNAFLQGIGQRNTVANMEKQNAFNMAAVERDRINSQNDQLYQMQLAKDEEQRKYELMQARVKDETDKDRMAAEEYMKAPTKEGFVKLSINRPNVVQAMKPILDSMNENEKTTAFTTMIKASTALDNKQPEIAERVLDEAKAAYGNAGNQKQVKLIDDLKEQMKANPQNAKALFTMYSTALSPEFGSMQSAQLKQQQGLNQANLEANKTIAETNEKLATTAKINSDIKMLPPAVQKLVDDNVEKSISEKDDSLRTADLANRIETGIKSGGVVAKGWSALKNISGFEGTEEQLKTEYNALRSKITMSALPPGPATDKDIILAMSGTPDTNASPETIASFLRGVSKLRAYESKLSEAKSVWFENNKGLGKSPKEIEIFGLKSKPNETFIQFKDRVGKDLLVPTQTPQAQEVAPVVPFKIIGKK